MLKNDKKKYILPITPYAWMIFVMLFLISIVFLVILNDIASIILSITIGLCVLYWSIFLLRPIKLTDEGVLRGKKKLFWHNLKIVVYPMNFLWIRGYRYCIIFNDKYCNSKLDIKKQKKLGFYMLLNKNNLIDICKKYQDKIIVVDRDCDIDNQGKALAKYKSIIDNHNKQFGV